MKSRNVWILILIAATTLLLPNAGWAQGRLFDKVIVDLPNDTHVNEQVLPAGRYEFRQMRDPAGGSHVMLVTQNGGSKYSTDAITIPAVNNNTPNATRVIVLRVANTYYLDKIWIAGKDYGYEFVLPESARSRLHEVEQAYTVSGNYQTPQVAQAAPPPPPPPPAREPEPVIVAVAEPPPPPPPPAAEPAPAPPPELPKTSSTLPTFLLTGLLAIGAAALLRSSRRAS